LEKFWQRRLVGADGKFGLLLAHSCYWVQTLECDSCWPGLWVKLYPPLVCRGLCPGWQPGEVRPRLRGRLGEGHERRSVRSGRL